jgi:nucleoside-diphosphate-sugar epimerase
MHVLVTGLDGFTGHYVNEVFTAAGHQVTGLQADLLDALAVADELNALQPDAVLHLAAIAFVGHGDPNDFYHVNVIGTRNLLNALNEHVPNLKKVVLASSANIYGNNEGVMKESATPAPANDYAASKLAMEYMANIWVSQLPIVIARPFNYTGVGQAENFLIPKIVSHFRRKADKIELGNVEVWRDFGDVRSVVDAYLGLINKGEVGETYNICSGKPVALKEVLIMCEQLEGYTLEIRVNPDFVRANEVVSLTGDASKLKSLLPQWSMPSLQETLSWMLREDMTLPLAEGEPKL